MSLVLRLDIHYECNRNARVPSGNNFLTFLCIYSTGGWNISICTYVYVLMNIVLWRVHGGRRHVDKWRRLGLKCHVVQVVDLFLNLKSRNCKLSPCACVWLTINVLITGSCVTRPRMWI